ncbi:MAG: aromatic amino acid lyase [Desulfobacterales bacterium]|nr:aromatic amino acid lyase [Desulfobacterales bacterium]
MTRTPQKGGHTLVIDGSEISLQQIVRVARGEAAVEIDTGAEFTAHMEQSRDVLIHALERESPVYGVTTGFGKCCGKRMISEVAEQNGINLIRFHGCGTGAPFDAEETRAAMVCRLACFARGYSGVSMELMQKIAELLNADITPVVPSEGSVGASGDLTPMSYVAAVLMGERQVFYRGRQMPAAEALAGAGISPHRFFPKEPLAIMNGTAMMTGVAAIVLDRAEKIANAATDATALCIHAIGGNSHHYYPAISRAKPHPGQKDAATRIAEVLSSDAPPESFAINGPDTLQDPYSLRCAPQVIGVLTDALEWVRQWLSIEANSANDNPLFDPESGSVLMGGNFYGGHVSFAMDGLKSALASVADMADRQVALMVDANVNRGLPADLVGVEDPEKPFHHGFKAMSISASALAAEALKQTMPAASFSRSTESHNQDKVSMGTIAARDAKRICELAEKTVAICLLAGLQACELRGSLEQRTKLAELVSILREIAPPTIADRPMDTDIDSLSSAIEDSGIFTSAPC